VIPRNIRKLLQEDGMDTVQLIKLDFEIILDSYAVVRNNTEILLPSF
jgi:hypothetical protein